MDKEIDELGKPIDKTYLECNLPKFLVKSIKALEESWEILDRGERDLHWDLNWCELQSDINYAQFEDLITREQANYLREKYLRMEVD